MISRITQDSPLEKDEDTCGNLNDFPVSFVETDYGDRNSLSYHIFFILGEAQYSYRRFDFSKCTSDHSISSPFSHNGQPLVNQTLLSIALCCRGSHCPAKPVKQHTHVQNMGRQPYFQIHGIRCLGIRPKSDCLVLPLGQNTLENIQPALQNIG